MAAALCHGEDYGTNSSYKKNYQIFWGGSIEENHPEVLSQSPKLDLIQSGDGADGMS